MSLEQQTRNALREWLAAKNGRVSPGDIDDDTALVSNGILKSIHVLDLILWIEERLEHQVEVQSIRSGSFASIDAIHRHFFHEEADHAARSH